MCLVDSDILSSGQRCSFIRPPFFRATTFSFVLFVHTLPLRGKLHPGLCSLSTSFISIMAIPESAKVIKAGVMYYLFGLVVQTFFFGAYTILIFLSTRMMLKRTLSATVNKVMFGLTLFMYVLSVAYWCYSVADGANRLYSYIGLAINPAKVLPDHTQVTRWSPLFDALTLLNYVVSDGIVVWRAWVICLRKHRMFLWITVVLLGLTALTVLLTIIFRIVDLVESSISELDVHRLIDIFQVATLGTSLLSNLSATGVVSVTA